jgi:NIPSNAP
MKHCIEIRAYNLKPGTRDEFHRLVLERSLPMLERWNVDVVAFGPSPHDQDSYYLIRRYESLADRKRSQDTFYGSDEWRKGPREAIVSLIVSDTSIVLDLEEAIVQGLRAPTGSGLGSAGRPC